MCTCIYPKDEEAGVQCQEFHVYLLVLQQYSLRAE